MKTKTERRKQTVKPILPSLIEVVKLFGEIHYTEATELLVHDGVWSHADMPLTPAATVNAYLSTAKTGDGRRIFEPRGGGSWAIADPVLAVSA